jgi:hypothetical protein
MHSGAGNAYQADNKQCRPVLFIDNACQNIKNHLTIAIHQKYVRTALPHEVIW